MNFLKTDDINYLPPFGNIKANYEKGNELYIINPYIYKNDTKTNYKWFISFVNDNEEDNMFYYKYVNEMGEEDEEEEEKGEEENENEEEKDEKEEEVENEKDNNEHKNPDNTKKTDNESKGFFSHPLTWIIFILLLVIIVIVIIFILRRKKRITNSDIENNVSKVPNEQII